MCCVLVILLCCCCWPRLPLPLRCLPAAPSLPLSSTTQTHSSTVSSTVQSPTDTHCTISLLSPPFILVHVLFSFFFLSPPSLPVSSIIFSPTHTHFRSFPVHLNSSLFSPLSSFLSLSFSQDHLCPVHARSPLSSASGLHDNRLLLPSAGPAHPWICICSVAPRNAGLYSHSPPWTEPSPTPHHRSVELCCRARHYTSG